MIEINLADACKLPLEDQSVDLVFGSPPYCDARTYGIGAQRDCREWIDWMLQVTREACRVSRGLVLWVAAGVTRDHNYWPACEGLLYRWWEHGGQCWRPAYWHRVGIPGSGGKQWLKGNIEYVLAFKGAVGPLPWADNVANGEPCKGPIGGAMSYRHTDGQRCNAKTGKRIGIAMSPRLDDGSRRNMVYVPPERANPGNLTEIEFTEQEIAWHEAAVVKGITVGGGRMGHDLAHDNEAPFPLKLAEWFIRGWCPPDGIVCDPFSGSGTTAHAAYNLGRNARCFDIRLSQVLLGRKRLKEVREANAATN